MYQRLSPDLRKQVDRARAARLEKEAAEKRELEVIDN